MKRDIRKNTNVNFENEIKKTGIEKSIPISKLLDHPDNEFLFGKITEENTKNLIDGIEKNGFLGTIGVWSNGDDTYTIFSGHRRKFAMLKLNNDTIRCSVIEKPSTITKQKRLLLECNVLSRGSFDAEEHIYVARQIEYLKKILEEEGYVGNKREEIAKTLGTSQSNIQRCSKLFDCIPEIVELEKEQIIHLRQAAVIAGLDKDKQLELYKAIKEKYESEEDNYTGEELNQIIDSIKDNKDARAKNATFGKSPQSTFEKYKKNIMSLSKKYKKSPCETEEEKEELKNLLLNLLEQLG